MIDRPPLSLALAALRAHMGTLEPRKPLEHAARTGFRFVTLDTSAPGLRPRELDRSARRDLAAIMRRLELGFAGLDLWIPAIHFHQPESADRAVSAVLGALDLAADLAALCPVAASLPVQARLGIVSLSLPGDVPSTLRDTLLTHADKRSVQLADHTCPPMFDPTTTGLHQSAHTTLGVGLDPAACLLAGENPAKLATRLGSRLVLARLSDASEVSRVEPGLSRTHEPGRLNDLSYVVALETVHYAKPMVLDLRGVPQPEQACERVRRWWQNA